MLPRLNPDSTALPEALTTQSRHKTMRLIPIQARFPVIAAEAERSQFT